MLTLAEQMRVMVQTTVNGNIANAAEIAKNSGMTIKMINPRQNKQWTAHYTGNPGEVELSAKVKAARAFTQWQCLTDVNDLTTWTTYPIDPTLKSTTVVKNLPLGKVLFFRYRSILKAGPSEWSEAIKLMIV